MKNHKLRDPKKLYSNIYPQYPNQKKFGRKFGLEMIL